MSLMAAEFRTNRRVEFCDTDMAGIVHFSNYFKYMESVEHEFLRSVGLYVVMHDDLGTYGFPKLQAECKYKHPANLDGDLQICARIDWNDGKSITYQFDIEQVDVIIAEGLLQVACCRFLPKRLPYPIPLPDVVLNSLETAVKIGPK